MLELAELAVGYFKAMEGECMATRVVSSQSVMGLPLRTGWSGIDRIYSVLWNPWVW